MKTLLIAQTDDTLCGKLAERVRDSGVPVEEIYICGQEASAMEYLREHLVDVLLMDIRMGALLEQRRKMDANGSMRPFVIVTGILEDFSCAVEMMRLGVRDYFTLPVASGLLENRLKALDEEIRICDQFFEKGRRVFATHLRYLLLHPDMIEDRLLDDLEYFFQEVLNVGDPYRVVIACAENGPLPIFPEIVLEGMEGGTFYLISLEKANKLMELLENGGFLGISREHSSIYELPLAYQEAVAARKVAFVCGRSWEEYRKYSFEESTALELWKEKYLYELSVDRLDLLEKKPGQWFFESRHMHVSPFQLLQVMNDLCAKLNQYYGQTVEENCGISRCPLPLDSPSADIFLRRFEQWTETCRDSFYSQDVSPQNVKKIRRAMDYIQENYRRNLSMAAVSNYVSMNYTLFSNEFKKYCGINFVNYLKEIRMREAKRLLEETNQKVSEISRAVGYENDKHFMKTFRSSCGMSPTEYRHSVEAERRQNSRNARNRKK